MPHESHRARPVCAEKEFTGQPRQAVALAPGMNCPMGHASHVPSPHAEEKDPGRQATQSGALLAPPVDEPGGQREHRSAPVDALKVTSGWAL